MRKKSREIKQAMGTYRPDRDKNNPQYEPGATCPAFLSKYGKAEWRRVAPLLESERVLRQIDQSLLATYCQLWGHWRASEEDITKNGLVLMVESTTRTGRTVKPVQNPAVRNSIQFHKAMMATCVKFGINPLDRGRIDVPQEPEDDSDDSELDDRDLL